ncbi:PLDc N-terminal domain-containing protein [Actinomadura sp. SCN-SB]|uniref:PLDc N-terminal domain-containing protein n=1 Tax=Actinomadura sp. SCN-SB TaxID=3373092 RepID=UPI00375101D4
MVYVLLSLILIGVWLFGLFDVLTTDESEVLHLPKVGWLLIVLLGLLPGAVLWLAVGRAKVPVPPGRPSGSASLPAGVPESAAEPPRGPEDDPAFLRDLERRLRGEE